MASGGHLFPDGLGTGTLKISHGMQPWYKVANLAQESAADRVRAAPDLRGRHVWGDELVGFRKPILNAILVR
jgi:hypothetical protein